MSHRIPGDTLAISDRVAMMPTVQPAAAGTQEYLEVGRTRGGLVRVIGREDIRSASEKVETRTRGAAWQRLPDRSGVFLAGTLSRFLRSGAGFAERELQALQPVADRPRVGAEVFGRRRHQPGERGDQPAG